MNEQFLQTQLKYTEVSQLPTKNRKKTDCICCIYLLAYVLVLGIVLAILFNPTNLNKITYPTDNQGRLCGYDLKKYPYVYYTSFTDPTKRLCVSACPKAGQTQLSCAPTKTLSCRQNPDPLFQVTIYNTYLDQGRIGLFCLPTNPTLKSHILSISNTQRKYNLFKVMDTFFMCAWLSAILGIILFVLIQYQPEKIVPWSIFLGGICSILFGFFVLTFPGYIVVKIILCVLLVGVGIISLRAIFVQERRDSTQICARYLHASTLTHSSRQTIDTDTISCSSLFKLLKPITFIIVFMILYGAFFMIVALEVLASWSYGTLVFIPSQPFYRVQSTGSIVMMVFILFQLLWVISFLRQSFNFIAGGHAIYWYFDKQREAGFWHCTKLLVFYHMGSITGSAFLHGIFYFIDLLVDLFTPESIKEEKPVEMQNGILTKPPYDLIGYDRFMSKKSNCIKDLFTLIHGQAIYYILIVNIPYCNAARYCQFLGTNSSFYYHSQLTSRLFRINVHIVPIFVILIIAIFDMGVAATDYAIMIQVVLIFFIVTFFLSYHLSKADALLISTYTEEALTGGELTQAPDLIAITYAEDMNYVYENMSICDILCKKRKVQRI